MKIIAILFFFVFTVSFSNAQQLSQEQYKECQDMNDSLQRLINDQNVVICDIIGVDFGGNEVGLFFTIDNMPSVYVEGLKQHSSIFVQNDLQKYTSKVHCISNGQNYKNVFLTSTELAKRLMLGSGFCNQLFE